MASKLSDLVTPNPDEQDENVASETQETPETQTKEMDDGTDKHPELAKASAQVPEKFQAEVAAVVDSATLAELDFLRAALETRESALKKSKTPAEKAGDFDTEGLPE